MEHRLYRLYGIEMAVQLLRPGALWEISNGKFTRWEDPRPCPTIEEVFETMEKIKKFEDSINTIWLSEQKDKLVKTAEEFDKQADEHN
jgi:hypothetical protein